MQASQKGHLSVVELLLKCDAQVNLKDSVRVEHRLFPSIHLCNLFVCATEWMDCADASVHEWAYVCGHYVAEAQRTCALEEQGISQHNYLNLNAMSHRLFNDGQRGLTALMIASRFKQQSVVDILTRHLDTII